MEANTIRFMAGDINTHTLSLNVPDGFDERSWRGRLGIFEATYRCWMRVNARLDDEDLDQYPVEYSATLPVDVTVGW